MNKGKKFYKVYEIIDNVCEELDSYPTYFVGAFVNERDAIELCGIIDVTECNSTKIIFDEITYSDIEDLNKYGLQAADEPALLQMASMLENKPKDSEFNQTQPE